MGVAKGVVSLTGTTFEGVEGVEGYKSSNSK
jgi:hypothetical protein